jgi:hypothetical protein
MSSSFRRLGRSTSTLMTTEELRRLLMPLGSGDWQPVFKAMPVYLLAEWRPFGASVTADRRRLLFFLPAFSHKGRQCNLCSESFILSSSFVWSWRHGGGLVIPSGASPATASSYPSRGCLMESFVILYLDLGSSLHMLGTCSLFSFCWSHVLSFVLSPLAV